MPLLPPKRHRVAASRVEAGAGDPRRAAIFDTVEIADATVTVMRRSCTPAPTRLRLSEFSAACSCGTFSSGWGDHGAVGGAVEAHLWRWHRVDLDVRIGTGSGAGSGA